MYTVNKGSSKLVAKTRGGLNPFKAIDVMATSHDNLGASDRLNPQRPVFHTTRKNHHHTQSSREHQDEIPPTTPQHEELVKFIQNSWTLLAIPEDMPPTPITESITDQNGTTLDTTSPTKRIVFYSESPSDALKDFTPFDLESWWGRRLFNNITNGR